MCKKVVDSYPHSLEFIPECHKIKKCKIKLLIPIHLQIKFVPEWFMNQELCDIVINIYFFVFDLIPDWYKTQQMCGRVVFEDPILIVYCPDKHKTQRMRNKAVDDSLAALKLIPD